MGYVGFVAHYPDGRVVREGDGSWDEVVTDGLSRLALVTGEGREIVALDAEPGERFWFVNECVASLGRQGVLSAKVIGRVDDERAREVRLDILRGGVVTERVYPVADLRISPSALRAAA